MLQAVRRPFTLVELLIVICIISVAVGGITLGVRHLSEQQRFLSEARQVLHHLTFAQNIMLISDNDVRVFLEKDSTSGNYTIAQRIAYPADPVVEKQVERSLILHSVGSVVWNEEEVDFLPVLFSLGSSSRGVIALIDRTGQWRREIVLEGYPTSLRLVEQGALSEFSEDPAHYYPIEVRTALEKRNRSNESGKGRGRGKV